MILAHDFSEIASTNEVIDRQIRAFDVAAATPPTGAQPERVVEWFGKIAAAWRKEVAHTMELARVVAQARTRLLRGEWARLWQDSRGGEMPFSKRKGEMLVVIGERLNWANAQTFAHFPSGWSILYCLARLNRVLLEKLLAEGVIHPKLTLAEAKRLTERPHLCAGKVRRGNVERRLRQLCNWVDHTLHDWRPDERDLARRVFSRLEKQIGGDNGSANGVPIGRREIQAEPSNELNGNDKSSITA